MSMQKALTVIKAKKTQQLNLREAKLINEGAVDGLLRFNVDEKNSGSIIHYNVEGLVPLGDFLDFNPMNKQLFTVLLRNLVVVLKAVENNHFSKDLIVWSLNSSYIEPSTWRVYLMYIPLQPYELNGSFKSFILDFISTCTFDGHADYVQQLVKEVNSGISYTVYMLNDFCERSTEDLAREKTAGIKQAPINNTSSGHYVKDASHSHFDEVENRISENQNIEQNFSVAVNDNGVLTVFRKSPNSDMIAWLDEQNGLGKVVISKFPFRIGKMEGVTDYRVYSNKVSRKHADIIKEQGKYYVIDLGSTNGTFLNGKRIQPGVKEELSDGAYLKLADIELKFHID